MKLNDEDVLGIHIPKPLNDPMKDYLSKIEESLSNAHKATLDGVESIKEVSSKKADRNLLKILIAFLVGLVIGVSIAAWFYNSKIETLESELNAYKVRYDSAQKEKESAIIDKALADMKAKLPVKEYIKGDTITKVEYVEKESSKDADLSITNPAPKVIMEYNGEKQELAAVTKEGKKLVDGKWVITQESSTVLNVDDVVNRQIALTIEEKEHQKKVLERQKIQNGVWGLAIGYAAGKL